jgi:hypothetical protein
MHSYLEASISKQDGLVGSSLQSDLFDRTGANPRQSSCMMAAMGQNRHRLFCQLPECFCRAAKGVDGQQVPCVDSCAAANRGATIAKTN